MPKIVIHYFDFPFWRAEVSRLALHLGKVGIHFFCLNYFLCIMNNTTILKNIVHPKLDLVTTRYSELHDLVNKNQLPSYFILYQYSI